ncbi:Iron/zinc purple acid phosphatase-like protein [Strongyloides ratti]|uniref:Purple acid phosphatase n=1 Tax=Strongyloides ratti TaxID=34506 RepID=A0A090LLM7_STRRB|nr:Iron/zinc purple acid phosphatase-like protein [Strongyloides ratti]CEF68460.1 Iron/zinc purple acid phosphatase-like protein [Strongyloides ratti]
MIVSWVTFYDYSVSHRKPIVKYGTSSSCMSKISFGRSKSLIENNNSSIVRYYHTVYLKNLNYNKKYYYKVGDGRKWSKKFYFKTFPGGSNFDMKLCVFGDMDTGKMATIKKVTKAVKKGECQLIIHLGDIAYQLQKNDGLIGDDFMRKIEPIAAYAPYMVIVGNHEFDCTGFTHYNYRFIMPLDNDNIDKTDHFYSFNLGFVNFVGLSSEVYGFYKMYGIDPIKRQAAWLHRTLKNIQTKRYNRPWIISYFHRPLYCWYKFSKDECNEYESTTLKSGTKYIPGLEKYLYDYSVDLVLNGHEHGYQRMYPVYNRTVYKYDNDIYYNTPAPTYVTSGVAGCVRCTPVVINKTMISPFSAKLSVKIGYTQIHVMNKTHMKLTQISAEDDKIEDKFWIIKNHNLNMQKLKKKNKGKYYPYNGKTIYPYLQTSSFIQKCLNFYNASKLK